MFVADVTAFVADVVITPELASMPVAKPAIRLSPPCVPPARNAVTELSVTVVAAVEAAVVTCGADAVMLSDAAVA